MTVQLKQVLNFFKNSKKKKHVSLGGRIIHRKISEPKLDLKEQSYFLTFFRQSVHLYVKSPKKRQKIALFFQIQLWFRNFSMSDSPSQRDMFFLFGIFEKIQNLP